MNSSPVPLIFMVYLKPHLTDNFIFTFIIYQNIPFAFMETTLFCAPVIHPLYYVYIITITTG